MSDQPLVSVLMTSYNREKYIAEAIESVLASSYTNFELIISDDCSVDSTREIVAKYLLRDKRVQLLTNSYNLTQFPNRNRAAAHARGEIIMTVDSDDTIKPDAIEYVVKQFERFPSAQFALVYALNDITDTTCLSPSENIRKHFFNTNHLLVGPGGSAIRTIFFRDLGGYPENYGPSGDCYFNMKAAINGPVILLPYVFFNYRVHGEQEFFRKYTYLYNGYRYLDDVLKLSGLPLSAAEKRKLQKQNKRRFLFNCLMYIKTTGKIKDTFRAFSLAGFTVRDFIKTLSF